MKKKTNSAIEKNINSSIKIIGSKEEIFKMISNHEETHKWVSEVELVKMIKEGTPKNGLGAIREVNFKPKYWPSVQEKITLFKPNEEYNYQIIKMAGVVDHLGVFALEENGKVVTVHWKVYMAFKKFHWIRLIASKFSKDFKTIQEEGLLQLKETIEN